MTRKLSIIIPARNEAASIGAILSSVKKQYKDAEIIVVDDGSTDNTRSIAIKGGARVISSPYSKGNGSAIKTGARHANGDLFVFMDGDGQHDPVEIEKLLEAIEMGYDMAIGSRCNNGYANLGRFLANISYNGLAGLVTGHKVEDLTSGFRAVRADIFRKFLYLMPNGFSYPTTITMAMYRSGYSVCYVPVKVSRREGKSHIKPIKDGIRFLLIIFKIGVLYAPLKIFAPTSLIFFVSGLGYYLYTFIVQGRFTNMSMLLFIISILVLLVGMVSEQLTVLLYSNSQEVHDENKSEKS